MHKILLSTCKKYSSIVFVGGGTGGHIQPIISIISTFPKNSKNILWIGGENSQESSAAKQNNIPFQKISILKLSTTRSPKILLYPFVLIKGVWEARKILQKIQKKDPNTCVFSKGGPGSVAVGIAAWSLGISLYIHESDTIPGNSNRLLGKFATQIFLGFDSAKSYFSPSKCATIGQILHPVFYKKEQISPGLIQWKSSLPHLLVICGSQGSRAIFEALIPHVESITQKYEILLILGKLNTDMKQQFMEKKNANITVVDWIDQENIAALLPKTQLAITRGSATTLAELDTFHIKKIIIPLPSAANNHQYFNAMEYKKQGDIVLDQKNIDALATNIVQM